MLICAFWKLRCALLNRSICLLILTRATQFAILRKCGCAISKLRNTQVCVVINLVYLVTLKTTVGWPLARMGLKTTVGWPLAKMGWLQSSSSVFAGTVWCPLSRMMAISKESCEWWRSVYAPHNGSKGEIQPLLQGEISGEVSQQQNCVQRKRREGCEVPKRRASCYRNWCCFQTLDFLKGI